MPDTQIVNLDTGAVCELRYTGPDQTFKLAIERIIAAAMSPIDPVIEDFLEVACAIFFADSSFPRGSEKRPEMGADWRRQFQITIPVQVLDRWSDAAVLNALTDVAAFLTDDSFTFRFVARDPRLGRQQLFDFGSKGMNFKAEEVILFSGGLDSFAGALEALSTAQGNVLLVSHRSAPKVMPRQDRLAAFLIDRFPNRLKHVKVDAHRIATQARDTTQRSRTLLFAALGQAVAQSFGAGKVSFYENGIVSQNLPISSQVVGTMATRTTHPLAVHKLNLLLALLRPEAPLIRNGYAWLTKTEVVQRIAQHGAADQIRKAVSCTSVIDQTTIHPHCGICSQCLDRRFGILAAGLGHEDPADGYKCDVLLGPRGGRGATMAVEWTRHALRMAKMTQMDLFRHFGLELSAIFAGHPELSPERTMQLTLALQQRHSDAVGSVLTAAIQENAPQIANGDLDAASLLMMHIGSGQTNVAASLRSDPRWEQKPVLAPDRLPKKNVLFDREAPLRVAFFMNDKTHAVSVEGLCDIIGRPAKIAHGLKQMFDEDRSAGLEPHHHRYLRDYRDLDRKISSSVMRQLVKRCRDSLAESHRDLFGEPPTAPLLIQNKQSHGYRLDPTIHLTKPRK